MMAIKILIVLIFVQIGVAQPREGWIKRFPAPGGDSLGQLFDIFATAEGGFAMTGYASTETGRSIWLLITDGNGEVIDESLHPPNMENARCAGYSIIQDDHGGYVIGGEIDNDEIPRSFGAIRVDENGAFCWWREWGAGRCYSVIELKSGEYLACGTVSGNGTVGKIVKFNFEGETIWEFSYEQVRQWTSMREIAGGAFLVGYDGHAVAGRIDSNGDLIDEVRHLDGGILRSVVSCQGGFATAGVASGGYSMFRLESDGDEVTRNVYELNDGATGLAKLPDGGFVICGGPVFGHHILRVDNGGNLMWHRQDRFNQNDAAAGGWQSVITDANGFAYAVGSINSQVGVLIKLMPDISPPIIVDYSPIRTELTVLLGDGLRFNVWAIDHQEDSLWFLWERDGVEIGDDPTEIIHFDTLGVDTIRCTVFDSTGSDQVEWEVMVAELYISAFTPDSLNLTLRRGTTIDFSIDRIRQTAGDAPEYLWTKSNLSNGEQQDFGTESGSTIDFPWSGDYTVEGKVTRGESSDQVIWNVAVRGTIWAYVPEDLVFDVEPETVVHFEVVPSEPENESLTIQWFVEGEFVREGELGMEWRFGRADLNPHYQVSAIVADSVEADTVTWEVTIRDLAVPHDPQLSAFSFQLSSAYPNPFNSMLSIRYSVGQVSKPVSLAIYDLSGRLVTDLLSRTGVLQYAPTTSSTRTVVWNASAVPAGVYLVRLQSGSDVSTQKVVLMR